VFFFLIFCPIDWSLFENHFKIAPYQKM